MGVEVSGLRVRAAVVNLGGGGGEAGVGGTVTCGFALVSARRDLTLTCHSGLLAVSATMYRCLFTCVFVSV